MPKSKLRFAAPAISAAAIALATGRSRLTTQELATLWDVSAGTLKNWRSQGRGPRFITIGSSVRYRAGDIAAFERRWSSK